MNIKNITRSLALASLLALPIQSFALVGGIASGGFLMLAGGSVVVSMGLAANDSTMIAVGALLDQKANSKEFNLVEKINAAVTNDDLAQATADQILKEIEDKNIKLQIENYEEETISNSLQKNGLSASTAHILGQIISAELANANK